jgi:hypothetical protein
LKEGDDARQREQCRDIALLGLANERFDDGTTIALAFDFIGDGKGSDFG